MPQKTPFYFRKIQKILGAARRPRLYPFPSAPTSVFVPTALTNEPPLRACVRHQCELLLWGAVATGIPLHAGGEVWDIL